MSDKNNTEGLTKLTVEEFEVLMFEFYKAGYTTGLSDRGNKPAPLAFIKLSFDLFLKDLLKKYL